MEYTRPTKLHKHWCTFATLLKYLLFFSLSPAKSFPLFSSFALVLDSLSSTVYFYSWFLIRLCITVAFPFECSGRVHFRLTLPSLHTPLPLLLMKTPYQPAWRHFNEYTHRVVVVLDKCNCIDKPAYEYNEVGVVSTKKVKDHKLPVRNWTLWTSETCACVCTCVHW